MRYEYTETARLTLVNPPFHTDRTLDSRHINVTVRVETTVPLDPGSFRTALQYAVTDRLHGSTLVAVDDAYILKLLEPKTGNTVHNFLERLRTTLVADTGFVRLGGTIPPDTINGYTVYVLRAGRKPCLEAVADIVHTYLRDRISNQPFIVCTVIVNDGSLTYAIAATDPQYLAE